MRSTCGTGRRCLARCARRKRAGPRVEFNLLPPPRRTSGWGFFIVEWEGRTIGRESQVQVRHDSERIGRCQFVARWRSLLVWANHSALSHWPARSVLPPTAADASDEDGPFGAQRLGAAECAAQRRRRYNSGLGTQAEVICRSSTRSESPRRNGAFDVFNGRNFATANVGAASAVSDRVTLRGLGRFLDASRQHHL